MENKKYSVADVFEMIGEDCLMIDSVHNHTRESITVDGFLVKKRSMRYATFYQKGCKCVSCGKEGVYFQLDPDRDGGNVEHRRHFNLYAEDGTLMTKDHILPKKWGGTDTIDNFQTMCQTCNEAKGSQYDLMIDGIIATKVSDSTKERQFFNIEKAIDTICNESHIYSQGGKPSTLARKVIKVATRLHQVLDTNLPAYGYTWKRGSFYVKGEPYKENN